MGAVKFRQGRSVRIGLPQNAPKRIVRTKSGSRASHPQPKKEHFLMATLHALMRPFTRAISNYRGRGNK